MAGRTRAAAAPPGETDVWIVDLTALGTHLVALERDRHLLTEAEIAHASRITGEAHRNDWIAAHVALHLVLMKHLGRPVQFAFAGAGKPRVSGWNGEFSLSHSAGLAVIAVRNQGRVGIDVEVRRPVRLSAERRHLIEIAGAAAHPEALLLADDAEVRFLTAWTRLEAIGKMRGTGIGALLETLGIVARGPGADAVAERTRQLVTEEAQPIGILGIDVGRFDAVAALATSPPTAAPELHDLATEIARLGG